jgi:hypothetical protein
LMTVRRRSQWFKGKELMGWWPQKWWCTGCLFGGSSSGGWLMTRDFLLFSLYCMIVLLDWACVTKVG